MPYGLIYIAHNPRDGDFRKRSGRSQPKIYDGGKFKMHLLEDEMG